MELFQFITGSLEDVKHNLDIAELDDNYKNPTETLPLSPPPQCNQNECGKCKSCNVIMSATSLTLMKEVLRFVSKLNGVTIRIGKGG